MPFPTREVQARQDIADIFQENVQNILQKTNVSNMIGLLQQLNTVSKFAAEIFTDILQATDMNKQRIYNCKQRLKNIEQRCPAMEAIFVNNAPSYFYDNPYVGKEWQRRDPLRGLLFRRDRCIPAINRRREQAQPAPTELNLLNSISADGSCLKKFTDSNFFMNEWLEAEKLKMKEAKRLRKAKKKKKKKSNRKTEATVLSVQKTKYDPITGEKIVIDGKQIEKTKYHLTDERNNSNQQPGSPNLNQRQPNQNLAIIDLDDCKMQPQIRGKSGVQKSAVAEMAKQQKILKQQQKAKKKAEHKAAKVRAEAEEKAYAQALEEYEAQRAKSGTKRSKAMSAAARKAILESAAVYTKPQMQQMQQKVVEAGARPPPIPAMNAVKGGPPPIPGVIPPGVNNNNVVVDDSGGPPPVPPPFVNPGISSSAVDGSASGGPPPIPMVLKVNGGPPPLPSVAVKKKLSPYEMSQLSMQQAIENAPAVKMVPPKPQMGRKSAMLLNGIRSGVKLIKAEPVEKYVPKDSRTLLMNALRKKAGGGLKKVTDEMKSKPLEPDPSANVGSIFEILNRRRFMADDSSEEDSSDSWESE